MITAVDDMKKFQQQLSNENGQALFEMILFIPFLLFLYTIYYSAGNSINGAINQQKAVRGYYYISIKNNSYVNTFPELEHLKDLGLKKIGFSAYGWSDHFGGSSQETFGTCFKFSSLLQNGTNEDCNSSEREEVGSSHFVRIFTYYGVCGPTYIADSKGQLYIHPSVQADGRSSCENRTSN